MPNSDFHKLPPRLILTLLAVTAAVIAGGAMLVLRGARPPEQSFATTASNEPVLTLSEERALTREMLSAMRKNNQAPAEPRPNPTLGEREPVSPQRPPETAAKDAPERTAPSGEIALPRNRPLPAGQEVGEPTVLSPVVVGSSPPPEPPRGWVTRVFSTVSVISGKAANLTGETATFVIELPGRLLAVGGKLFERTPAAPAPRRDYL